MGMLSAWDLSIICVVVSKKNSLCRNFQKSETVKRRALEQSYDNIDGKK